MRFGPWQLDFARGAQLEVAREEPVRAAAATLIVTSGLHRGASIELTGREYLIGSDEDCDIVLRDAQVAPRHCRLVREWRGFSLQDIRTEPPQPIRPRSVSYHPSGVRVVFEVAGVSLTLRPQGAKAALRAGKLDPRWMLYAPLAVGALAIAILLAAERPVSAGSAHSIAGSATAGRATGLTPEMLEQVRHALAGQDLQIGVEGGRLRIAGTTGELEVKNRIRSIGEDLRGIIGIEDRVAYVDTRRPAAIQAPFPVTVRGVMVGNPSYFLTDRGDRYYVGGVLPDGAEVLSIEPGQIRFRLGGKIMVYHLE